MAVKSFVMYADYLEHVELLSNEEAGILFKTILLYVSGESIPDLSGQSKMAFSFIRANLDRDIKKYYEIIEKRTAAGKKGGRPKKANGFSEKQTKAKKPININETINKNINEAINDNDYIISCPEPETPDRQPIITLTLNDKTEYPIYTEDFDEWAELYPAVDIMQALRSMKGWLNANPTRRKTKNGIRRFINSWLSREQDRGKTWTAADKKEAYDSNADLKAFAGVDDYDREEIIDMEEQDE